MMQSPGVIILLLCVTVVGFAVVCDGENIQGGSLSISLYGNFHHRHIDFFFQFYVPFKIISAHMRRANQ